jgi:hypothetical protein
MAKPFPVPVFPYLMNGYLKRGRTLGELAVKCGIDPAGLERTVTEFNVHARFGEDPEFGRGSTAFNRGSGDKDHGPNPSLAPLEKGPFYAIRVLPGSFGTFYGLKADADARVLRADGTAIPGLYAAGSDQANVMGGALPIRGNQHRPGDDLRLYRRQPRREWNWESPETVETLIDVNL